MKIEYRDGNVVITIPYKPGDEKNAATSSTGKSRLLANTKGFADIEGAPDALKIGVNLIYVIPKNERAKS